MNSFTAQGASADSGSIASFVGIKSSDSPSPSEERFVRVEYRLAKQLSSTESFVSTSFQTPPNEPISGIKAEADSDLRLPMAWKILTELLEKPAPKDTQERLERLLRCLEIASQARNETRVAFRDYVSKLQLYSLLPIYLRVDQCSFESALNESLSLALQAMSLIDLDRGLESELFELLGESAFIGQPPCVALEDALKLDLFELANALSQVANNKSKPDIEISGQRIPTDRCIGYWSIVQQWSSSTTHLRIPSQLSIGKVLWPKVREHWTRLSQSLLEPRTDSRNPPDAKHHHESRNQVAKKTTVSDGDFIEIRNSNDPQLAKTLDIQLQRCREEQGAMSLVVVKVLAQHEQSADGASHHRLPQWQETVIEHLRAALDGQTTRGFQCDTGELTLVIDDLDRNEVSAIMREVIEVASQPPHAASSMVDFPRIPLVCGIGCVSSPSKRFQIEQLIHSAWRCLDAAKLQGPGAVKSIEVF